jgi:hypothetical protein
VRARISISGMPADALTRAHCASNLAISYRILPNVTPTAAIHAALQKAKRVKAFLGHGVFSLYYYCFLLDAAYEISL